MAGTQAEIVMRVSFRFLGSGMVWPSLVLSPSNVAPIYLHCCFWGPFIFSLSANDG